VFGAPSGWHRERWRVMLLGADADRCGTGPTSARRVAPGRLEEVQVDPPGPGNDRSLTADEARVWELIEKDLRLRARRRHRVAGFVLRSVRRPLVVVGILLIGIAGVTLGAALLPEEAAITLAAGLAGLGLLVTLVGVVGGGRRTGRPTRRRFRRRSSHPSVATPPEPEDPPGPELV